VRAWARIELAGRWRALVVLGILAGLAGGLGLAAVSGARRTATVYDRFRQATAAPDAILFATQLGIFDQDYSAVVQLPEVLDAGTFNLAPVGIGEHDQLGTLAPGDDHLYRTLSRPLLVEGRLPDPARVDEVVVNRAAAARLHLRVGQRLTLVSSDDIEAFFGDGALDGGPTTPATIVGIGDSFMDLIFTSDEPGFVPSGAVLTGHPEIPRAPNLVVRLRPGTDVKAFRLKAAAALGLSDIPVRDLSEDAKRITHATDLERNALLILATVVAAAGTVLVGQSLTRTVYAMAEAVPALRALGFTRADVVHGLGLPLGLTALTGAVVAIGSAVLLSGRFPVGLARRLEPDPGLHTDWPVLAAGAGVVAVLVIAGATYAAWRAARAAGDVRAPARGSRVVRALAGVASLPVTVGAGLALEVGRGERTLPVRPAIAGAVAGILGVVGSLGLVRGIDDALATSNRSGQVWDASILLSERHPDVASVSDELLAHADVGEIAGMRRLPLDVDGAGLPVYALDPLRGDLDFAVLEGRAPSSPDEAAIGPATGKALGKGIGDELQVDGGDGVRLRIVGTTLLPQTAHSSFDQGVWVTPPALAGRGASAEGAPEEAVLVTAAPGIDPASFVEGLQERFVFVEAASVPQDVLALRNVRGLPLALAAFLVSLALAALGHVLVTAVRRRGHDLAVLRALGLRPRQSASCIAWQATTIAVVGLGLGLPLGVVAGRLSWRSVADSTPLLYVAPLAVVAMVLAVPLALLAANLLAVFPARRAARLRPADLLRSE
jgi:ABC-type lipoprotein release transport system permease subunit